MNDSAQTVKNSAKVWMVLAGLILIYAGMSGILSNTLGVFFSGIINIFNMFFIIIPGSHCSDSLCLYR